jgi:C4-type Zn-finger protein
VGFRPVQRMSEAAYRSLTIPACTFEASAAENLVNVVPHSGVVNSNVCKSLSCEHKLCDVHRIQAINTRRHYAMLQFRLAVTFQRQIVDAKSHTFNFACSDSVVFPNS